MKRVLSTLVITLFLAGIFIVPVAVVTPQARLQENITITNNGITDTVMESAELPNDPVIRVALYNETDPIAPSYATGIMNGNYSAITNLLNSAGYSLGILTLQDIQDYKLTTANYDVLVLADNCPKDNITDIVKDFWLAGGGILSLDSAIAYLGYGGILYRENESIDDGYGQYWGYYYEENSTVQNSHPVTQSYQVGDLLKSSTVVDTSMVKLETFNTTSVWSQTTILTVDDDNPDRIRGIAVDAYDRGGKVVNLGTPGGGNYWSVDYEPLIVDAVNWLAPRPKARLAFDFSHQPRLSIDDWDVYSTLTDSVEKFSDLRDLYVAKSYTVDKFIPSSGGNFTASRLADYDILILAFPDLNYTEAERTALMSWLNDGGGLIVLGDRNQMTPSNGHLYLNFLLDDLDMYLGENNTLDVQNAEPASPMHPTVGGMATLRITYRNYIYLESPTAQSVWEYDGHIAVAAQEYGSGRVVMFCDMNILSNSTINTLHNLERNSQYALNVANWLSADDARVMVFSDDPYGGGVYRNMVSQAMNQLQIPYFMTTNEVSVNMTLNGTWYGPDDWDLVIVDNCNYNYHQFYDTLLDYLLAGGQMILTSWTADVYSEHPLWSYVGVNNTDYLIANEPSYIWDTSSPIFDGFVNYTAPTLNVTEGFGVDGAIFETYDNATALAGYTPTPQDGNASIIISNSHQVLFNGFMLNNLGGDADHSGYKDGFELYMNEITFMSNLPDISSPADLQFEDGTTGNDITWSASTGSPSIYEIYVDNQLEDSGSWDGSDISYTVDDIGLGVHAVECRVFDTDTTSRGDVVFVTVIDTSDPILNSPADITMTNTSTGNEIEWIGSDANPGHYVIVMNSTEWDSGTWDGSHIVVDLDSLDVGTYFFTLTVNDTLGHEASDSVVVTVTAGGGFGLPDWLDTQTLLIIVIGILALIIIVLAVRRRK